LGNLYGALIDERLARQSGGVFYLRVEDTDDKRAVDGAVEAILSMLAHFGVRFDEGAAADGEKGAYGPYRQRARREIYHILAKYLVEKGAAYPCFMTGEELEKTREAQKRAGLDNFGCYGKWAACRDFSLEEVTERIEKGEPYVLRFRSEGKAGSFSEIIDGIRGKLTYQENFQDFVLLKSDGIPTYHFAHAADDHLMRTTHVVRGEEWLATLPLHLQLFAALGWEPPVYCHTATLMKLDDGAKRKLSKRRDPELSLEFYKSEGYLPEAVREYLLTVLNSNFEEWRLANPLAPAEDFKFTLEKTGASGALFDLAKLDDISKEVIAKLDAKAVYAQLTAWAREYAPDFYAVLAKDAAFSLAALSVGRNAEKPRKDFINWKQTAAFLRMYFDETFAPEDAFPVEAEERKRVIAAFLEDYDHGDGAQTWFEKVRAAAPRLGYAAKPKDYKKNPELYQGHVGDFSAVLRVAVTGRANAPDLWEIFQTLGEARVRERLQKSL
jgi:glutamyl-tRNA synthetase